MIRQWLWQGRIFIGGAFLTGCIAINGLAYLQAKAMLTFQPAGAPQKMIHELSSLEKLKAILFGLNISKAVNNRTPADIGLPFETHHIQQTDAPTLEGWYLPHPTARGTVILFHGYASAKSGSLPEAKAYHDLGFAVFLVDFRASGGSEGYQTSIGYHEAVDVVNTATYVQRLADGLLILHGHSMGAAAILRAVAIHKLQPDAIIIEAVFDKMLSAIENRFALVGLPAFPLANLMAFWGGIHSAQTEPHNPVEYAHQVDCPALVLHGSLDDRALPSQAETVFANLSGPKQFVTFEGLGHESYLAVQADKWRATVSVFLADGFD